VLHGCNGISRVKRESIKMKFCKNANDLAGPRGAPAGLYGFPILNDGCTRPPRITPDRYGRLDGSGRPITGWPQRLER